MLHHAKHTEDSGFVQIDTVKWADQFPALGIRDLELTLTDDSLSVRFVRDNNNVARRSPYQYADVFTLLQSQWGRLTYNGRYTCWDTGNWWYEKSVYNIGWFVAIAPSVFVQSEPTCSFTEMERLR